MNTKYIYHFFTVVSIVLSFAAPAQNREVSGVVILDSDGKAVPGENVTAYVKTCRIGTISDNSGYYTLSIPDSYTDHNLSIEFSLMGYETATISTGLTSGPVIKADTVILKLQPLMLTAAYLIDNGMPPGDFIMSKVWDRADENRRKMESYNALVHYSISTHEIPLVAQVLSGVEKGAVKLAAGFTGYGPLVRYCLANDDVSASVSMERSVTKKKTSDFNKTISSGDKTLPKDVSDNILSLPKGIDFFEAVYNRNNPWGEKFTKKHHFNLIGTYEYCGKLVDVLHCSDSQNIISVKLHVVEEEWGILRVEIGHDNEVMLFECRDVGNGVYMPVSLVMKPTMSMIHNSDIPAAIEKVKENSHLNKGTKKRAETLLKKRFESGLDFNPYIVAGFNISYTDIE